MPAPKKKIIKKTVFVLTGTKHTSKEMVTSERTDFTFIKDKLQSTNLDLIMSNPIFECFYDSNTDAVDENKAFNILLSHLIGFTGCLYGTGVIVFYTDKHELLEATKKWYRAYLKEEDIYDSLTFSMKLSKIK